MCSNSHFWIDVSNEEVELLIKKDDEIIGNTLYSSEWYTDWFSVSHLGLPDKSTMM